MLQLYGVFAVLKPGVQIYRQSPVKSQLMSFFDTFTSYILEYTANYTINQNQSDF